MTNTRTQVTLKYSSIIIPRPPLFESIINDKYINYLVSWRDLFLTLSQGFFFFSI